MVVQKVFFKVLKSFQINKNACLYVRLCKSYSTSANVTAKLSDSDTTLTVNIGSSEVYKYPYTWLRDNCQCSECFHKGSQSRTLNWDNFDVRIKPMDFKVWRCIMFYIN